jgi:O-antigen/teichoic acid export membrane protein
VKSESAAFNAVVTGTGYSLAALVAARFLAVISSIVVARLLGRTNLGMVAIVNNVLSLTALFATVGIPVALTRFVAHYATNDRRRVGAVLATTLGLLLPFLLLLGTLLFASSGWLANRVYHNDALAPLLRIAAGTLVVGALGSGGIGQAFLQGLKEIRTLSLVNIVTSAAGVPVIIGLTATLHLTGNVLAQMVLALIGLTLVVAAVLRLQASGPTAVRADTTCPEPSLSPAAAGWSAYGPFRFEGPLARKMLNIAVPSFLSGLVMTPALWFTTTRLSQVRGFGEVGLFNICFAVFQMILFIPTAVGMPLVPLIAESGTAGSERVHRLVQSALNGTGLLTFVLAVAVGAFAQPMIRVLYGAGYSGAAGAMTVLAGAAFLSSLSFVFGHYFAGTGKMWVGMAFNFVWFALLIGSSLVGIGRLGVTGLALCFLGAYLVMTIAILIYARVAVGVSTRYTVMLCSVSVLATGLSFAALQRLHGPGQWASRVGIVAVSAALGYWLLPAKTDWRRGVSELRRLVLRRMGRRG